MTRSTQVLARYASAQVSAIRTTVALAREGDPEAVHDARVAVRRLRSTLRTFRPLLERATVDPVRADLQWLGTALGRVRDAQVLSDRLIAAVHAEPVELVVGPVAARIRSSLAADTAHALEQLARDLDDPRFARVLSALDHLVDTELARHQERAALRRLTRRALRRADRKLAAADTADGADRDRILHDARRAYKRARYAVETLEATAGKPAARLARRLTKVQDVLGAQHDTIVARQQLRSLGMQAQLAGENGFTYGLLYAEQGSAARHELASLAKVAGRARRRSARRWLH